MNEGKWQKIYSFVLIANIIYILLFLLIMNYFKH